jgi:hypothetical protein
MHDGGSEMMDLISDAQAHSGNVSGGTPSVGYSYDASNGDRLTSITYPNGRSINYNYNGSAGLDTILNRISSISNGGSGSIQAYTYLGLSTPVTMADGNGIKLNYGTDGSAGFDQFGRVIDQNWQNSSGTSVDEFQYGYDANSNVLYKKNAVHTNQSELYAYDNLNRLTNYSTGTLNSSNTSISGTPTTTESWNLDAVGNSHSSTLNGVTTTGNETGTDLVSPGNETGTGNATGGMKRGRI